MRILVLLTDLFEKSGGIQTFNRSLVKALNSLSIKNNWKIIVYVLNDFGDSNLQKLYVNSSLIRYKHFKGNKFFFVLSSLYAIHTTDKVIFGHINFSTLAVFFRLFRRKLSMYLVVYGIEAQRPISPSNAFGVSLINRIISISNYTKEEMININKIKENKLCVLYCTLDPLFVNSSFNIDQNPVQLPQGKILLTVSRLDSRERYKNIDMVIKSIPLILKELKDVFYIIVGDGDDRKRLENLSKELNVENHIIFTGEVNTKMLSFYYKNCDIFVLLSTKEGFGIVFLEAMYYAKPCIGTREGGIKEVVEDLKTGILLDSKDLDKVSTSMLKLLKDPELCKRLGTSAKERLNNIFSFTSFCNKLEDYLTLQILTREE